MTAPAWMPLYIADYLADTGHLSTTEHGAYLLLIMHYWQHDGVPTEDAKLARIARMTTKEWAASRETLQALFGSDWRHGRVDKELLVAKDIADKRSTAGRTAGLASATARQRNVQRRSNDVANGNATTVERYVNPLPSPSPDDLSSSVEIEAARDRFEGELRDALGERSPPENVDFTPISELILAGHSPLKDILPACRAAASKTTEAVGSWRYYAEAVKRKPKSTPAEPVKWLPADSPLWGEMNVRSQQEKKRPLIARGSIEANGVGAFVPAAWLASPSVS